MIAVTLYLTIAAVMVFGVFRTNWWRGSEHMMGVSCGTLVVSAFIQGTGMDVLAAPLVAVWFIAVAWVIYAQWQGVAA